MANLTKANKITVGGGLHSRIASAAVLKEATPQADVKTLPNRICIISDFSGSMDSHYGNVSKMQHLKDAIQDFSMRSDSSTTALAVQSFPRGFDIQLTVDKTEIFLRLTQATALGSTPMHDGLSDAWNHSPTRCILISDGDADDPERAVEQARRYKERELVCDTVHIGDSSRGEELLKKIAELTGGMFMKFTNVQNFATNFHYLLPESRAEIAGMLPEARAALLGADTR